MEPHDRLRGRSTCRTGEWWTPLSTVPFPATKEQPMTAPDLRIVSPARASDWTEAHIKALAETDVRMAMEVIR